MDSRYQHTVLPSGKSVMKRFAATGLLAEESHAYGMLEIGITLYFKDEIKVAEAYFKKGRMVSRQTYEKARLAYPDMPAADATSDDFGAALSKLESKRRRVRRIEANNRKPNLKLAQQHDAFCKRLLKKGRTEKIEEWIENKSHTLGELDWLQSKRLVKRLLAIGCVDVFACEVDRYPDGTENTGHLVIQPPKSDSARTKVFRFVDRLANNAGYDGPSDDGQEFLYVGLD